MRDEYVRVTRYHVPLDTYLLPSRQVETPAAELWLPTHTIQYTVNYKLHYTTNYIFYQANAHKPQQKTN